MKGTLVRTPRWCFTDKTVGFFGISEKIRILTFPTKLNARSYSETSIFDRKEMTDGAPFLEISWTERAV